MKGKIFQIPVFLVLIIGLFSLQLNGQDFEGIIKLQISSTEETVEFDYTVKGNKILIHSTFADEENPAAILFDNDAQKFYVIMHEEKMFMEFPAGDNLGDDESSYSQEEMIATGEYKEILGYKCEKIIIKSNEEYIESWMTKDLGKFFIGSSPLSEQSKSYKWQTEIEKFGFPLELTSKDLIDNTVTTLKVKEIIPRKLSEDIFKIPSSYQKFDLPFNFSE